MYYKDTKLLVSYNMAKISENLHMALMRVRRMAQLTLPAEVRRAGNLEMIAVFPGLRSAAPWATF